METWDYWEILNLIACELSEPIATVKAENIEHLANQAARIWCTRQKIPIEEVSKVCGMCLIPYKDSQRIKSILKDIAVNLDDVC